MLDPQAPKSQPVPGDQAIQHELMTTQLKTKKIQLLLLRIGVALLIAYLVLVIIGCLLLIILPLFGIGIFGVLIQQLRQLMGS